MDFDYCTVRSSNTDGVLLSEKPNAPLSISGLEEFENQ